MSKKTKNELNDQQLTQGIVESAGQIWLAGLAAFEKAQQEGNKLFESLVKEGEAVEARSKKLAGDKIKEARTRVQEAKTKANNTLDKLEQVFQDRVSRSLNRLGVPTHEDLEELSKKVDELKKTVQELSKEKKP